MSALTPEQILAHRANFERLAAVRDPFTPLSLLADGFSYEVADVNMMWEGFLMGVEHSSDNYEALAAYSSLKKPSEFAEDLRKLRGHSKCFTTAYDRKMPSFTLIAQDNTAPKALAQWIMSNMERLGESHPKIISAKATLGAFVKWENQKGPD